MLVMHFAEVEFVEAKAKEGECENKCHAAVGHFTIVFECTAKAEFSCNGLKKKTKETDDCIKYCPSRAGKMK